MNQVNTPSVPERSLEEMAKEYAEKENPSLPEEEYDSDYAFHMNEAHRMEIEMHFKAGFLAASPKDVLNFIYLIRESFIGADKVYTLGSCYQFYRILKFIFPLANAYYNSDHVITEIEGKYYDITGEVEKTNHLLMDEHYPESTVMQNRYNALLSTQQGEDATEIIKGLKDIINYFGRHDKTTEEHRMYAVAQKILKTFELSD